MGNQLNGILTSIKKNPFFIGLFAIVIGVAIFVVFTLSEAVDSKIAQLEAAKTTSAPTTTEVEIPYEEKIPENTVHTGTIKKYSDLVETVSIKKEASRIAVTVEFKDEGALLEEHYAQNAFSVDVVPVFHFYINNGTKVELPGELRLLSDGRSVVYYLSEISDFANVVALTEQETVTLDNIMNNDFNIYLRHKTRDGVGRTVVGTYGQSVEQFKGLHATLPLKTVNEHEDVERVETTVADDFIWLDIYFNNEESYNKYNSKLKANFICFGLENGGKLYKWDFIVTEYNNLNMLRCKFDRYSLTELLKAMGADDVTVKTLFNDYAIQVWCSDYSNETDLFCINEEIEVRQNLNKSTAIQN